MDIDLLKQYYNLFKQQKSDYETMYDYYKGDTDAMANYKMVTERSNNKTPTNFMKKFIKEEISYSFGNDITYISKSDNESIVSDIDYYLDHWSEDHDIRLAKFMLIFSTAYELYYVDREGNFSAMLVRPDEGYLINDDFGNPMYFMRVYTPMFTDEIRIDLYDDKRVYHLDEDFKEISSSDKHFFGSVPVAPATLSEEGINDTIFKDIKGLQDAYETNLSDISNEISDMRNAYLCLKGVDIAPEDVKDLKRLGVMQIPNKDGDAKWLIKNINDTFIQNTLSTLEDKMYQLTSHINHNEKMQSNTSSLALRSRLISLEEKCKLNQKALVNCIKIRLKFLFKYLNMTKNIEYDYRDIKIKFTPNIPQDDLMSAQIINLLGDKLSTETGLSLLSFIENPKNETKRLSSEMDTDNIGALLLGNEGVDNE